MKYFKGAAILPNRVGLPMISPAQCLRSSSSQYKWPSSGISERADSVSAVTGGTVRTRASMTPAEVIPLAIWDAIAAHLPVRL